MTRSGEIADLATWGRQRSNRNRAATKKCAAVILLAAGTAALMLSAGGGGGSDPRISLAAGYASVEEKKAPAEADRARTFVDGGHPGLRRKGGGRGGRGLTMTVLGDVLFDFVLGRRREDIAATAAKRPAMYTFYDLVEEVSVGSEESRRRMLTSWASAWHRAGWEPQILTMQDARRHPEYAKHRVFLDGNPWGPYNSACFWRWFAMATIEGGGWMSDYDVFPLNDFADRGADGANYLPNGGNITSHERHVPSLVSGSQSEWDRMAKVLVDVAHRRKVNEPDRHFSDMLALEALKKELHDEHDEHGGTEQRQFQYADHVQMGLQFFEAAPFDDEERCRTQMGKVAVHLSAHSIDMAYSRGLLEAGNDVEDRAALCEKWIKAYAERCGGESPLVDVGPKRLVWKGASQT